MEPDAKPVVDHQRRLNPKMKEVASFHQDKHISKCLAIVLIQTQDHL